MKKLISILFAVLCLTLAALTVSAAEPGLEMLKVNPYGGEEADIDTVRWYETGGQYFLFLPADVDMNAAKLYFQAEATVLLDGKALENGGSAAAFTPGVHQLICGTQRYSLTVCCSEALPAVFLQTESGSLDYIHASKENKEPGNIRVYENGVLTLDKALKQIKGRGNSTWYHLKKPYNIKFDKKTGLLGMDKAKKWTLLANYLDLSLLHNACGFELGEDFGLPYTSQYRWVDLYINGDYLGNYIICESVEVGENRVDIPDLEKANEAANPDLDIESLPRGGTGPDNTVQGGEVKGSRKWIEIPEEPADVTGGYLLEYEFRGRYDMELCGFVTPEGQPVVIKSPEYASRAEVNYIADLMDAANEALYSPTGYNAAGKHYSEYFDVDSLASIYILNELSMNCDAGFSSFFAFKPAGEEKICFGPVWDMDLAFGCPDDLYGVSLLDTTIWCANQMGHYGIPSPLAAANRHPEFRALVREKWAALQSEGILEAAEARINSYAASLRQSAVMNGLRWNRYHTVSADEAEAAWQQNVSVCTRFLEDRIAALDKGFGPNGAYLYYAADGASDGHWVTPCSICQVGDSVIVCDVRDHGNLEPPQGRQFYCWSTEPEAGGDWYFPGDTLTLTGEETVLYAVWKTQEEIDFLNHVVPFEDVPRDKYYYDPVFWAYYHDPRITSGTDNTHFMPGRACTREQIVTFLYAAAGKPQLAQSGNSFSDVKPDKYYFDAVTWAAENGITEGVGSGKFGVGKLCTREQVITFLWKAAGAPEPARTDCPFADVSANKYYYMPVLWALENGITHGINDTTFGVGKPCTRAQVVTFLYAACDFLLSDSETPLV